MFEQVKAILKQYTEAEEIKETSALDADLGLSSFDVVSIVTDFEDAFGIEIPDQDIPQFLCVKDIVTYLNERT